MKQIRRIREWVVNYWQGIVFGAALIGAPLFVLVYRLNTLTDRLLLTREAQALGGAFNKQIIFENPLQLVFKLPEYGLKLAKLNTLFGVRLISVCFALVTALAIYYVARQWYGNKTAIATLVMTVTSSWLLAYGRLATPDIVYPLLLSLGLAYGAWIRKTKHSGLVMVGGVLLGLAFVYTSGLIWLAIMTITWQRRIILQRIADAPRLTVTILVIVAVGISPLVLASILRPELITQVAGLASSPNDSFANLGIRSVDIIQQFAVQGHQEAEIGIVNVALLDIFTYVMAILGLFTLFNSRRLDRFKVITALLVVVWALVSLGGPVPVIALFPIVYLLTGAGISRLLGDWLKVFPRNPLARTIGLSAIGVAVGLSSIYHLQRYFIAWPEAPATTVVLQIARTNAPYYENLLQY